MSWMAGSVAECTSLQPKKTPNHGQNLDKVTGVDLNPGSSWGKSDSRGAPRVGPGPLKVKGIQGWNPWEGFFSADCWPALRRVSPPYWSQIDTFQLKVIVGLKKIFMKPLCFLCKIEPMSKLDFKIMEAIGLFFIFLWGVSAIMVYTTINFLTVRSSAWIV